MNTNQAHDYEEPDYDPENDDPTDQEPGNEPEAAPRPPEPKKQARRRPAGKAPEYLRGLLDLEGVGADVLDNVNTGTAWVRAESSNGIVKTMPLAHLAPDALGTLADYGLEGHTTFEIRTGREGGVLRYFACMLEALDPEENEVPPQPEGAGAAADPALVALLTRQQNQLNALSERLAQQQAAPADPFAAFEKMIALVGRVNQSMAALMPPQAPAGGGGLGEIIDVIGKVVSIGRGAAPEAEAPDLPEGAPQE